MHAAMPWPAILLLLSRHSRGLSPQQARRTPHAGYHGQGQIDFFEGWYNRITLPETDQSFAFIYAIFDPGRRTARSGVDAQVLASTADATKTIRASSTDCSPFAAAPHDLSLRYAGADFSFAMTSLRHRGRVGAAAWDFRVRPDVGWGGRFGAARQYSTAGWLAALGPLLSPHYQVLMSLGHATGWVELDGQRTAFSDAPFYAEKNWGRGFPRKWWWLQCNAFDGVEPASELTLTATGARRSLLAGGALEREEDVGLVGIHFNGEFWPFPEVEWTVAPWGAWRVTASYADRGTSCTIEAETDDAGCAVRVPSKSGMVDGARETYRGTLRVTMFDKGREVVSATTRHACLETGGEFDAEWAAASAMTEPLKSVAYNVDLERAISSRLTEARRRGFVDVPGL
jgi:tocopherol cyclase